MQKPATGYRLPATRNRSRPSGRNRLLRRYPHRRQPAKPVRLQPIRDPEKLIPQLLRNRPGIAIRHLNPIH